MTGNMKNLNQTELGEFLTWAFPQVQGAQLQDIWSDGTGIALDLYSKGLFQIWIDLRPGKVFLVLLKASNIRRRQKVQRPVVLFLQSHAKNLFLETMNLKPGFGRVVEIGFAGKQGACRIEIEMIPNAVNLHVEAGGKRLSWAKPKDLGALSEERDFPVSWPSWPDYTDAYVKWRWSTGLGKLSEALDPAAQVVSHSQDPRLKNWQKDLAKKEKALARMTEMLKTDLSPEQEERWRQFGEALKMRQGPEADEEDLWNDKKDRAWNRTHAFERAKELRGKREGTEERILELNDEIWELQKKIANPEVVPIETRQAGERRGTSVLLKTESRGRTLNLPSGLQVVIGKSGRDNLAILRQARAWDLWLHLKDEAAAHAILFREKNHKVSQADLEAAAQWLHTQSASAKKGFEGGKFEVLVAECRFVKPIKGDKLGRVTYSSTSVYSFAAKRNS